jgi:hypothetical protein
VNPRLRILVLLGSAGMLRIYDGTLRVLADRGHRVTVALNAFRPGTDVVDIHDERVKFAGVIPKRKDVWEAFLRELRGTMDFVQYLDPRFADVPLMRNRMYRQALPALLKPFFRRRALSTARVIRLMRLLQSVERAVPVSGRVSRFLCKKRPDVVFVSPFIHVASEQDDTVRAARAAGVPVVAGIAGWDNLTSKGHFRIEPDAVVVWNGHQQREAVELHGMDADRVIVTGAQPYDYLFERQPSMSREEFCRMLGLPPDGVLILFAGSSRIRGYSTARKAELPFVHEWLKALRASTDPALRNAAVLFRPHPVNVADWQTADFADLGPAVVWPRAYIPTGEAHRASLFDSLFYCSAVVGINTSVMIEASILRKPVLSVALPEFAYMQNGTRHFRYLRPEHGGFLRLAGSLEEHLEQLAAVLRNPAVGAESERFVTSFVRPHGADTACAPLVAGAIERVGWAGPMSSCADAAGYPIVRLLLWPIAGGTWLWTTARPKWTVRSVPMFDRVRVLPRLRRAAEKTGRLTRVISHRVRRLGLRRYARRVLLPRATRDGSDRA